MSQTPRPDANWWAFSLDPEARRGKIQADASTGRVEVNPDRGGKRLLSYRQYLRLDALLGCQTPTSLVPDERVFLTTHQVLELVFKQTVFDLHVIATTLRELLESAPGDFARRCDLPHAGEGGVPAPAHGWWRPARTAAARARHSLEEVVPRVLAYLATDRTFDNAEFTEGFRENLVPASGFQSAQFRLLQRALGKTPLLRVRLFPADGYWTHYRGWSPAEVRTRLLESEGAGLVSVMGGLVLQEDAAVADPPAGTPLAEVARLDDLAHRVLGRLPELGEAGEAPGEVPLLPADGASLGGVGRAFTDELWEAVRALRLREPGSPEPDAVDRALLERRAAVFRADWSRAVAAENERRRGFGPAWAGVRLLRARWPEAPLAGILADLVAADVSLSDGFLRFHERVVARRLVEVPGTAGGGVPYLRLSRNLVRHFPALVAYRGPAEAGHCPAGSES
ncbi:MAG: tryptophan 2,3-dioxygenase family protein [Deferrisomatales bacterium]